VDKLTGMSVVLFCNKATHKQVVLVLEQTCKRYPSVNFLKVGKFFESLNLQQLWVITEKLKNVY